MRVLLFCTLIVCLAVEPFAVGCAGDGDGDGDSDADGDGDGDSDADGDGDGDGDSDADGDGDGYGDADADGDSDGDGDGDSDADGDTDGGETCTLLFESDWNTATGTSCEAISDGDAWDRAMSEECNPGSDAATRLEVVAGAGPSGENVLAVYTNHVGNHGWNYLEEYDLGIAEHDDLRIRFWLRVYGTGSGYDQGHAHYLEDHHNATNGYFGINSVSDTHWAAYLWSGPQGTVYDYPSDRFLTDEDLPVDTWLRIEIDILWLDHSASAQTATHVRIFESDGTLLKDSDDWHSNDYDLAGDCNPGSVPSSCTLSEYYEAGAYYYWDGTRDGFKVGDNGPASGTGAGRVCDVAMLTIEAGCSDH